ncbi:MAG: cation diffusion facilitator family transporter [Acidobacteriota bacterium]
MRLSLATGLLMLAGKITAYAVTGSAAIMSDAVESVIHVVAVAFAAFSLQLSTRPADKRFQYGYERIAFFSAGFEGAMIVLAGVGIIYAAVDKWLSGLRLEQLGLGALLVAAAAGVNGALGWYLIRTGRRSRSLILEANGRHVLTDVWTSVGVIGGLGLVLLTGWLPFDPIIAIIVALNILWSGSNLVFRSVSGLMDYTDPRLADQVRQRVIAIVNDIELEFHGLRVRHTGYRLLVELHLLFPSGMAIGEAHRRATDLEGRLAEALEDETEVVTHLEALEDHADVHADPHWDDGRDRS